MCVTVFHYPTTWAATQSSGEKREKVTDISVVHYLLPNLRPNVSYKIATYILYYAIHNNNKKLFKRLCRNG